MMMRASVRDCGGTRRPRSAAGLAQGVASAGVGAPAAEARHPGLLPVSRRAATSLSARGMHGAERGSEAGHEHGGLEPGSEYERTDEGIYGLHHVTTDAGKLVSGSGRGYSRRSSPVQHGGDVD
eukprot:2457826-Pleurochrysis_carterae.AAC.1